MSHARCCCQGYVPGTICECSPGTPANIVVRASLVPKVLIYGIGLNCYMFDPANTVAEIPPGYTEVDPEALVGPWGECEPCCEFPAVPECCEDGNECWNYGDQDIVATIDWSVHVHSLICCDNFPYIFPQCDFTHSGSIQISAAPNVDECHEPWNGILGDDDGPHTQHCFDCNQFGYNTYVTYLFYLFVGNSPKSIRFGVYKGAVLHWIGRAPHCNYAYLTKRFTSTAVCHGIPYVGITEDWTVEIRIQNRYFCDLPGGGGLASGNATRLTSELAAVRATVEPAREVSGDA